MVVTAKEFQVGSPKKHRKSKDVALWKIWWKWKLDTFIQTSEKSTKTFLVKKKLIDTQKAQADVERMMNDKV